MKVRPISYTTYPNISELKKGQRILHKSTADIFIWNALFEHSNANGVFILI